MCSGFAWPTGLCCRVDPMLPIILLMLLVPLVLWCLLLPAKCPYCRGRNTDTADPRERTIHVCRDCGQTFDPLGAPFGF
jgi:hypothetical protein